MNYFVFSAATFLLLQVLTVSVQSQVCYKQLMTYKTRSTTAYQRVYQAHLSYYGCGWFGWKRCKRYHARSFRQSSIKYSLVTISSTVSQCCSGYVGTPPNCQAQCTDGCQNGGSCTLPDVCTCAPGWSGANCEKDIDECVKSKGECQHDCSNNAGSYQCLCYDGYLLGTDKRSCEDINECSDSNGGCQHKCNNTIGSYNCSCDAGYSLDDDNYNCSFIKAEESSSSDKGNSAGPIAGTVVVVFVLVLVLSVVIVFVVIRYWRKSSSSSSSATGLPATNVSNNAITIAAAKKEKTLNDISLDNPTYDNKFNEHQYSTICDYENNVLPAVPREYEVPCNTIPY